MTRTTRNGLLVGSLVLGGGLLVLLVAGGVLGQTTMWGATAMQGGMGSGMMGSMESGEMAARHAQCQSTMAANSTAQGE